MKKPEWKTRPGDGYDHYSFGTLEIGRSARMLGKHHAFHYLTQNGGTFAAQCEARLFVENETKTWCANYLAAVACQPEATAPAPAPPAWVIGGKCMTRGGATATIVAVDTNEGTVTYEIEIHNEHADGIFHISVGRGGTIEIKRDKNCCCHPPCHVCETAPLACSECGFEVAK